ncbi:hypothetical protein F4225_16785, partial [Candidatus Poribacteria bacterium]|nr:hypothetical protein [Candidatus Poribacteria bacterium]
MHYFKPIINRIFFFLLLIFTPMIANADDWSSWRGPNQNGISAETDLISTWSLEGENILWQENFIGRSTPV